MMLKKDTIRYFRIFENSKIGKYENRCVRNKGGRPYANK
jgi:hypothetical protein